MGNEDAEVAVNSSEGEAVAEISQPGDSVNAEAHVSDEPVFDGGAEESGNAIADDAASGGGGGSASRMADVPWLTSGGSAGGAIAYSGDAIFDIDSAVNEAKKYIAAEYINASAFEQDGIWYVSFYTENEVITVSLEASDGALVELTRKNI